MLGIDNVIFVSILVDRLPRERRTLARNLRLGAALVSRIALLLSIAWIRGLTAESFTVLGRGISGCDLILFGGGLFLIAKSTMEIHGSLEGEEEGAHGDPRVRLLQRSLRRSRSIDIVFSFDSVIAAVGLVQQVGVMIAAIVASMLVMLFAAGTIAISCPGIRPSRCWH